ncbi:drug/metabolite exporter YedA [Reticulibacter mediterranei]|uniref:drug/metabolite exporter YedA n=1 Tax=Reticulibacter mediterranei TaxID=2778369 RepID=UPI001F491AF8|nr:drug/metabolite exporter YedA [Reticulibacter mediterranei]
MSILPLRRCCPSHDIQEERNPITQTNSIQQNSSAEQETSPTTKAQERVGIILALLALYLIWGSTYLGMSIALTGFPPFLMSGIRFSLAGILLFLLLRVRGNPAPSRAQWGGAAVVGTLLVVGGNGGVSFAEQWVASGLAAVAVAATPLWLTLIIGLMGRWPARGEWIGLLLGLAGVFLLNMEHGLWANPIGAISLLLAPMCWSLGSALSSRLSMPTGMMSSAAQMVAGGLITLLLGLLLGERITHWPDLRSLLALGYLVLFGSMIAYSAYGYVLRHVRPALATSYAYINPAVAVLLGALVAGERITPVGLFAMLIILTGVALVTLRRK